MIKRALFLLTFGVFISSLTMAQTSTNDWYLSIGTNATNFAGFDEPTDKNFWDFQGFPTQITIGHALNSSFSLHLQGSMGDLEDAQGAEELNSDWFWETSLQGRLSMADGSILPEDSWIEPYVFAEAGVNNLNKNTQSVFGGGVGLNFWPIKNVGANISVGYDITPRDEFNYLHASAGLAFRWGGANAKKPTDLDAMNGIDPDLMAKDSDKDGIVDSKDHCPNTPGVRSNSGCPMMKIGDMDNVDLELVKYTSQIYFETESAKIKKDSYSQLNSIIEILNKYPSANFIIEGHASSPGTDEYNMDLSIDRAKSIKKYLVKNGADKTKLWIMAFGENDPIATNKTETGKALNRRVEIHMVREE